MYTYFAPGYHEWVHRTTRTVIGAEEYQCVIPLCGRLERSDDIANHLVRVSHHTGKRLPHR
jgi:hypothetical protein